jgi:hypothetical protein
MNYKSIPPLSIEEIKPIRDTPIEMDEWILEEFMYTLPRSGKLVSEKPTVIDDMIYDILEQFNGHTFI